MHAHPERHTRSLAPGIPEYTLLSLVICTTRQSLYPPLRAVQPDSPSEVGAEARLQRHRSTVPLHFKRRPWTCAERWC
eukprot:6559127-Pyramimonas_sp.AAC.1